MRVIVFFVFLVGLSACHPWYLVESHVAREDLEPLPADVTSAGNPKWGHTPRIAVLAPDKCATRSWAETSGEADSVQQLLQTRCGVDMAELERALVQRGFGVSSWKAIDQLVAQERLAPLDAAKRLGAQVMLQVNSFERSKQDPLKELRWNVAFYESDSTGVRGPRAFVPEARAQVLEAGLRSAQLSTLLPERVGASLNVTAVDVRTGQSVWFFRQNHWQRLDEEDLHSEQLFLCNRRHLTICYPRVPARPNETPQPQRYRSGSEGHTVSGRLYASELDAAYHRVAREVIENAVDEFAAWSR